MSKPKVQRAKDYAMANGVALSDLAFPVGRARCEQGMRPLLDNSNTIDKKYWLNEKFYHRFYQSMNNGKFPMIGNMCVLGTIAPPTATGANISRRVYDASYACPTICARLFKEPTWIFIGE